MGKPAGFKRRADADWGDLPLPIARGVVRTELQWAIEDADAEEEAILREQITRLEETIERFKVTSAKYSGT
jgi:hypothetical protein